MLKHLFALMDFYWGFDMYIYTRGKRHRNHIKGAEMFLFFSFLFLWLICVLLGCLPMAAK